MSKKKTKQERYHVFVYGTLRQSNKPTAILHGYAMYDYGKFPYIVKQDGGFVYGEVHTVTGEDLETLDRYEGIDRGLYTRETVTAVMLDKDKEVVCFAYVGEALHNKPVNSGDWYIHTNQRGTTK